MMDLDNFKKINDTYGHTNGDKILCHFAQLLTGLLREEDIIGRIGGEEFSIILPHIRKETAFKIAERIRQKVAESQVVLSDNQMISYTVSIGITDNDANEKSLWDILKKPIWHCIRLRKCHVIVRLYIIRLKTSLAFVFMRLRIIS